MTRLGNAEIDRNSWEDLGLVFAAPRAGALQTHAMLPTPFVMAHFIRVYFASCDANLRGRIYCVDLDRNDPRKILRFDPTPVLDLGGENAFDRDGVNPSQIIEINGRLYLYYIGWRRESHEIPYTLFAGLATSEDDGRSFIRVGSGQLLHPSADEVFFRTAPFVFPWQSGWTMLYIGGGGFFDRPDGKRLPTYGLRQAFSDDGLDFHTDNCRILLDPDRARGEIGFGRPVLWNDHDQASLIISVRSMNGYALRTMQFQSGHIVEEDIFAGQKKQDWASDMTCFGAPCQAKEFEYLFYNGNQFGATGFGVARRRRQSSERALGVAPLLDRLSFLRGKP